jgi:eukaryotic-like serine/threonine-protein kinase
MAPAPRAMVADALHEARVARLVGAVAGVAGGFRFTHALVRDAAYDSLRPADLRHLHALAGDALERVYAGDVEGHSAELAHHSCIAAGSGGDVERAIADATRAAQRAVRLLAFEEAVRLYELALAALGAPQPDATRCDIVLAIADAQARAGNLEEAKRRFLEAADLARSAGLPDRLARAAIGYGGRFAWARNTSEPLLVPLLDEALDGIGGDDALRVQLQARLAGALRPGGARIVDGRPSGPEEAIRHGREAVALARRLGAPGLLGRALEGLLLANDTPATIHEGLPMAEEIVRLGEVTGDRERVFAGVDHTITLHWTLGAMDDAVAAIERAEALAAELGQPAQRWLAGCYRTMLLIARGELDEAERTAALVLAEGRRALAPANAGPANAMHCFLLRRAQDRADEVEPQLREVLHLYPWYIQARCALACCEALSGRRTAFDELAEDRFSAIPFGDAWLLGVSLLAEACVELGDAEHAAELYELLEPSRDVVAVSPVDGDNGAVAGVLGLLAQTLGNGDEAERHLRAALDLDERMGARLAVARSRAALGR